MKLVAGIDIGNSTTEIVISDGQNPIFWDRRPTRGIKGSESSIQAAAGLLKNIEREHELSVDHIVVAPWHPVATSTSTVHEPQPDTGRFQVIQSSSNSVFGDGAAIGHPWIVSEPKLVEQECIAVVPNNIGYEQAANFINAAIFNGAKIAAVLVEADEAVLIAKRLTHKVPVVDGVDIERTATAQNLFVEVRPSGKQLTTATDVWALRSMFNVLETEAQPLNLLARWVKDERAIVIGIFQEAGSPITRIESSLTWRDGMTEDLFNAVPKFPNSNVGDVAAIHIGNELQTSDVWGFDISSTLGETGLRGSGHTRDLALAHLASQSSFETFSLSEIFGKPVTIASSEATAAAIGANSTPGLQPNSLILDIGGGTIDLIGQHEISAAGAGELLSAAVAQALQVSRGAADWIKRGSARRLDSPHVLLGEDGTKEFVTESQVFPATATGSLVAAGPAGFLTFGKNLQPAEWRIMRQSLKRAAIGKNVSRLIRSLNQLLDTTSPHDIVVVGGPAADEELLPILGELTEVNGLGRGNVAGKLGHRYAVAYGLSQLAE